MESNPPTVPTAVRDSAATLGSVSTLGSVLGVDPGGAAVQAALTFMACRGEKVVEFDGTLGSWLSTLPISPFFPLGLMWAAAGNVLLGLLVAAVHCMTVVGLSHGTMSGAPRLRFPSLSVLFGEWLLSGVAVCGAALAVGTGGDDAVTIDVGVVSLVVCVIALVS